jgi:hypothetical protein
MRTTFVLASCLFLFACRSRLDGEYSDSVTGISSYTFKPNGKVVMSTFGIGMEMDYEVDGNEVKIKTGGGNMILKVEDDGSLGGPLGIRFSKKVAAAASVPTAAASAFAGSWTCEVSTVFTQTAPPGASPHTIRGKGIWTVEPGPSPSLQPVQAFLVRTLGRAAAAFDASDGEITAVVQAKPPAQPCTHRLSVSGSKAALVPGNCEQKDYVTKYSKGSLTVAGARMTGSFASRIEPTSPRATLAGALASSLDCSRN